MISPTPPPRRILVLVDRWMAFRDLIRGSALAELCSQPGVEVLVLTNERCRVAEGDLPDVPNVRAESVDFAAWGGFHHLSYLADKVCHGLARDLVTVREPQLSVSQKRISGLANRGLSPGKVLFFARLLSALGLTWEYLARLAENWGTYPAFAKILDDWKPTLIVYSNMLPGQMDCLREARRRRIPIVLDIPSWDQITSKGPLSFIPDHVLVWNKEMKQDTVRIHGIPTERVHNFGVLYFDTYFQPPEIPRRDEFWQQFGIPAGTRVVTYALSRPFISQCSIPFVKVLHETVRDEKLGFPCQLVVRVSPRDNELCGASLRSMEGIVVQVPDGTFDNTGKKWLPSKNEATERVATITHSDVIITIQSSMVLDASCLDRPVVNLGYDAGLDLPEHLSVRRLFKFNHAQSYQEEKATWIVRNNDQLAEAIRTYCLNPGLHRENRARLVRRICGESDGLAYTRWARTILGIASHP